MSKEKTRTILIFSCVVMIIVFIGLYNMHSEYLSWDYSNHSTAILGTALHIFEFLFIRIAPVCFIVLIIRILFTFKK
ncbi:MAG: hypothetical protein Q4D13_02235 [Erysipelotrichaceae bacterium]|nr:hypothetical protein [Erysipelotrichaceae bacterium]